MVNGARLFLLLFLICLQTQVYSQSAIQLAFFNSCSQKVEQHEFSIFSIQDLEPVWSKDKVLSLKLDSTIFYLGEVWIPRVSDDNFRHVFELGTLSEDQVTDTLEIPFLDMINIGSMHNQNWVYIDCSGIVDGNNEYYDKDGFIREGGVFENGKPIEISLYSSKGILSKKSFYSDVLKETKVEFYDSSGQLDFYEMNIYKKRKSVTKKFNSNHRLIERDIIYGYSIDRRDKTIVFKFNSSGTRIGREVWRW